MILDSPMFGETGKKRKALEAAAAGAEWDEEDEDEDDEVETELLASLVATIAAEGLEQPLQVLITVRDSLLLNLRVPSFSW